MMKMSLEKKLKAKTKMGTEIENMLDTDLEEEWKQVAEIQWLKLGDVLEELGKVADKIRQDLKDAEAVLKNSPKAPYFLGLQDAYNKVLGLLVEDQKEKPRTVCLSCGYDGKEIQGDNADLYEGYGCWCCWVGR